MTTDAYRVDMVKDYGREIPAVVVMRKGDDRLVAFTGEACVIAYAYASPHGAQVLAFGSQDAWVRALRRAVGAGWEYDPMSPTV